MKSIGMFKVIMMFALFTSLFLMARTNYLLFHGLVEVASVVVAGATFIIAWNSSEYLKNSFLILVGMASLFIGFLDLLHTFAYVGMGVFDTSRFPANQLWVAARYMESLTIFIGIITLGTRQLPRKRWLLFGYGLATLAIASIILQTNWFPPCFVAGQGQTTFKIVSEYVIIGILSIGLFALSKKKSHFAPVVYRYLAWSIIFTILTEVAFTLYVDNYGLANMIGHFTKVVSFYLVYRAIVETGFQEPLALIFRELATANSHLTEEIKEKTETQEKLQRSLAELEKTLEKIQALEGLLPMCAWCKKIRDDNGYWESVEVYLKARSGSEITHGVCPECTEKLKKK